MDFNNQYTPDHRDYEGFGLFEYSSNSPSRVTRSLGQLPAVEQLLQPTYINGLARVPSGQVAMVKVALNTMTFQATPEIHLGGVKGTATLILGGGMNPWVDELVGKGMVVMVQRASIPSGVLQVLGSVEPASVAMLAGEPLGAYVIIDGPPALIGQAEQLKGMVPLPPEPQPPPTTPGEPPPTTPAGTTDCQPGQLKINGLCYPHAPPCAPTEQEVYGECFPLLGSTVPLPAPPQPLPPAPTPDPRLPVPANAYPPPCHAGHPLGPDGFCYPQPPGDITPQPPAPPTGPVAKAGLPSWVLPVSIGAAVIGVVAIVATRPKRGRARAQPMRANVRW